MTNDSNLEPELEVQKQKLESSKSDEDVQGEDMDLRNDEEKEMMQDSEEANLTHPAVLLETNNDYVDVDMEDQGRVSEQPQAPLATQPHQTQRTQPNQSMPTHPYQTVPTQPNLPIPAHSSFEGRYEESRNYYLMHHETLSSRSNQTHKHEGQGDLPGPQLSAYN